MRIVYFDESGTGSLDRDPFLVIAGVCVHADDQLLPLAAYLDAMIEDLVPPEHREGFFFHAKDIYHGSGKIWDRRRVSKEYRFAILDELVSIPRKFELPVVWGHADRVSFSQRHPSRQLSDLTETCYLSAAVRAMMQTQRFMSQSADAGEVAQLVFENVRDWPKRLKALHRQLRDPNSPLLADRTFPDYLPFSHLIDTPHFAEKADAPILQLADVCAFAIKRKYSRADDWERFYRPVQQQCLMLHKEELDEHGLPQTDTLKRSKPNDLEDQPRKTESS